MSVCITAQLLSLLMDTHQSNLIDDLIDKFKFEKVHIAMTALDWKWGGGTSEKVVPTIAALKKSARRLLIDSVTSKVISSGGFTAKYHPAFDGEDEYFELLFILEEADSCFDD